MTFLAPFYLYAGIALAVGALAAHYIVTRQPESSPFPTVRFVPAGSVRVTTLAPVPEDRWLLGLRMLAALVLGAAFARPVLVPPHRRVARVVVADISRDVSRPDEVRDSVRALLRRGDALVVFDSAARVVPAGIDSIPRVPSSRAPASLSSALIVAMRAAAGLRSAADSIELTIVSPFPADAVDGATRSVRALWPGRVRLVPVAAASDSARRAPGVTVRAAPDDGVSLAAAATGLPAGRVGVRVVRDAATAADSAWAAAEGAALVRWPANGAPAGWRARPVADTAGGVVAGSMALVFPLERRWSLATASGRVVARWADGEPAAVERSIGSGCIRDVAIPVPTRGDFPLRPSFGQLVRALTAPCVPAAGGAPLPAAELDALAGAGPLAASARIAPLESVAAPLVPWLLALALLLIVAELVVRRTRARSHLPALDREHAATEAA